MARIRDEAALALEREVESGQHVVERRSEPRDLVVRVGHRQPAAVLDRRRPASHRLDRSQRGRRQAVREQRGQQERDRRGDEQLPEETPERLRAALGRRSDHQDVSVDRHGEQPGRIVEAGEPVPVDQHRAGGRPLRLGRREQRQRPGVRRGLGDRPVRAEELREAVLGRGDRTQVAAAANQRGDLRRTAAQPAVDRVVERRAETDEQEQPRRGEHGSHRERERRRQSEPDRQPSHVSRPRGAGSRCRAPSRSR